MAEQVKRRTLRDRRVTAQDFWVAFLLGSMLLIGASGWGGRMADRIWWELVGQKFVVTANL